MAMLLGNRLLTLLCLLAGFAEISFAQQGTDRLGAQQAFSAPVRSKAALVQMLREKQTTQTDRSGELPQLK